MVQPLHFFHQKALNYIASPYCCCHKPSSVKLCTESLSCKPLLHGRWDIWARKSIAAEGWDFLPQNAFQGTGTEQFLTMTTCNGSLYKNKLSDQNILLNMHYNQDGGCSETYFLCFVCLPGPFFIQIIKTEQSIWYYYLQPSPIFFHFGKVVQSRFVNSELWTKHMQKKMLLVLIKIYSQRYFMHLP